MNKILKYALLGTAAVAGIAVAAVAFVAVTFDPNDYKPQIIAAVKESQQRTLRLDGDIRLTFFPSLGADLGRVSLSEFNSDKEFVSVESMHVSLALLPLLSRQAVVDEVAISGLKATLVKYRNGSSNIDDLAGGGEVAQQEVAPAGPPVSFDIASVRIENTELHYQDEATGSAYSLKDVNLKSGRIANGVPSDIEFSANIAANQPRLDIATALKAKLTFDLEKNAYRVDSLDLQASGEVLDIADLVVQANGDASADMGKQEFSANKLKLSASGVRGKDRFEAKLDMPSVSLDPEEYSSGKVMLDARLDGAMGSIVASLSLPGMEGNAKGFRTGAMMLAVELMQPEQTLKAKLSSPLMGNLEDRQFKLSDLKLTVDATGDQLPNKSVSSEMSGSIAIDAGQESVQASLAGGLLQSKVAAKLTLNGFKAPVIRFDVDVDQFDADQYLPKAVGTAPSSGDNQKVATQQPEQPFDLSGLKQLDMEGELRIGALKVANVKLAQLRIEMKAHNGILDVSPLSANLYQGGYTGSVTVNAQQAVPAFRIEQKVSNINIGTLLKDATDLETVAGKGSVTLNLDARGNTVSALKKTVSGKLNLSLANGAFKQDGKTYTGEVKGNALIDGAKQRLQADVSGRMQQSKFTAKVALTGFDDPSIRFDVDLDQLDVDQYLPKPAQAGKQQAAVPEEPFDLTALNKLNVQGGLRIGAFKVMNLKLAQVRLDMKARKGLVTVDPLSAKLYQGSMNGSLSVNAQATPRFTINERLSNVTIAPLVKDLMDLDAVEGKGNVMLDLATQGNLVSALKKGLNGDAAVNLENGAIKGINLTKLMQNAQNIGKGATIQTLGVSENEKTEFSEFRATFKVKNGVAHNEDLSVQSPQLKITGSGDIDIGNESIEYTAKAMLQQAQGSDYLVVPVQLSGPFTDVKFKLDYTKMLEDLARRKLEARAKELKDKAVDDAKVRLQKELEKGLKGLFK